MEGVMDEKFERMFLTPHHTNATMVKKSTFGRAMEKVFKTKGKGEMDRGRRVLFSLETDQVSDDAERSCSPAARFESPARLESPARPGTSSSIQTIDTMRDVMFGVADEESNNDFSSTAPPELRHKSSRTARFSKFFGMTRSFSTVELRQNTPVDEGTTDIDDIIANSTSSERSSSPSTRSISKSISCKPRNRLSRSQTPSRLASQTPSETVVTVSPPSYFISSPSRSPSPQLQKRRTDSKFSSYSSLNTLSTTTPRTSVSTGITSNSSNAPRLRNSLTPISLALFGELQQFATNIDVKLNIQEDLTNHLCVNAKKLLEQKINLISHHPSYIRMKKGDKEEVVLRIRNIRLGLCNKFVRMNNISERSFGSLCAIQELLEEAATLDAEEDEEDEEDDSEEEEEKELAIDARKLKELRISLITDLERQRSIVNEIIDIIEKGLTDTGRILGRSRGERLIIKRFVGFVWARLKRMHDSFSGLDKDLRGLGSILEDSET